MTDNLRGILAVFAASTAFVGHDATVKLVSAELPTGEIVILRGLIATAMLAAGVLAMRATRPLSVLLTPIMLLRLAAAAGATVFIVMALRYLPLATVTTVLQATPLVVTAGAALLYGDVVGWRRSAAVLTGFVGVVLIVKPGGDIGAAAWLVLAALVCTTTRGLHRAVGPLAVHGLSGQSQGAAGRRGDRGHAGQDRCRRAGSRHAGDRGNGGGGDRQGLPLRLYAPAPAHRRGRALHPGRT